MVCRIMMLGVAVTVLGLSGVAGAEVTAGNRMRCDAQKMRKEGSKLICYARCMDRMARRTEVSPAVLDAPRSDCEAACDQRCKEATDRINQKPLCGGHEPGDPKKCAEKLLNAEGKSLLCKSRCYDRSTQDEETRSCQQACSDDYRTARTDILASDICRDGVAPTH